MGWEGWGLEVSHLLARLLELDRHRLNPALQPGQLRSNLCHAGLLLGERVRPVIHLITKRF